MKKQLLFAVCMLSAVSSFAVLRRGGTPPPPPPPNPKLTGTATTAASIVSNTSNKAADIAAACRDAANLLSPTTPSNTSAPGYTAAIEYING